MSRRPVVPSPFPRFLLFANYVASYVTARLGRSLFQSDHPEFLQSVEEYYASLQHNAAH